MATHRMTQWGECVAETAARLGRCAETLTEPGLTQPQALRVARLLSREMVELYGLSETIRRGERPKQKSDDLLTQDAA